MAGVFISYRRADSGGQAGRLYEHLSMRFGADLVFQDFEDIQLGTDFLEVIRTAIHNCDVVLVLIGPLWLVAADGRRRLDSPQDVLRLEILEAFQSERTIIPVLVGGAQMPSAQDLPEPIQFLARRNALELSDSRWNYDVGRLATQLRELIAPTRDQISRTQAQQKAHRLQLDYFQKLDRGDAAGALALAQEAHAYLDQVLPLYPQDPYLQVVRGYTHKNEAMALTRLGRYQEYEAALNAADRIFRTMIQERPDDAGAWNGRGSVEAIRGDLEAALYYVDRALEIDPRYGPALKDREKILKRLNR